MIDKLRCLQDEVLVKPETKEPASGLKYSEVSEVTRPEWGIVVAAGAGRIAESTGELIPSGIVPGDRVFFESSFQRFSFDGVEYLRMRAGNIRFKI